MESRNLMSSSVLDNDNSVLSGERSEPLSTETRSSSRPPDWNGATLTGQVERKRSSVGGVPDTEVVMRPARRRFTTEYKLRIVAEADKATRPGEIGAILRREGLYSSLLQKWRDDLRGKGSGKLSATVKRKQRDADKRSAQSKEMVRLKRENARLEKRIQKVELLLDLQKKFSEILGIELPSQGQNDDEP